MKMVTRDVSPDSAQDLLERVPRASISFASDHGPIVQPVGLLWRDDRCWVSFPGNAEYPVLSGQEVVLLVDEGVYYFDLRAIYIRGHVKTTEAPPDAPAGRAWVEVVPIKTVAWDYGTLREVQDDR